MRRPSPLVRIMSFLAILGLCALLAAFAYDLPFVQEKIGWRISELRSKIKYALSPPEEAVFAPNPTLAAMVEATLAAYTPTAMPTATAGPTATPLPTATATAVPTPIPSSAQLSGIRHEYQQWNNCGPTTLSMGLSFWGWVGDQRPIASYTKPNPRDKNVMPYELVDFVETNTGLRAITRVGGDLDVIKRFIAAGFPVIIEKGFEGAGFDGWMGHYQLLSAYDEEKGRFSAYDSFEGDFSDGKTLPVKYETVESYWPNFNNLYLVIYPPDREAEVMALLGPDADEAVNYERAAQMASERIFSTTGRDQFFAWFNRGTNLVKMQDYAGAAAAYDEAFALYAQVEEGRRPWRMMWYQTGPYWAYFYSGRYGDVINLATQTLANMSEPVLEESYYWRGLAREAIGDVSGAVDDLRKSVTYHPGWEVGLAQLQRLGATP